MRKRRRLLHGQVNEEIELPVLQRVGKQPVEHLGVKVQLQNAAPLWPRVGAVGDLGIDDQILIGRKGDGGAEQGEGDAAPRCR